MQDNKLVTGTLTTRWAGVKAQKTGLHDGQTTKHQQYGGAVGVKHVGLEDPL